MGIQIYLRKDKLKEKGIELKPAPQTFNYSCSCGYTTGWCSDCGEHGDSHTVDYVDVSTIPFLMEDFGEWVYHDANHWGNSREHLVNLIDKFDLQYSTDWYEG